MNKEKECPSCKKQINLLQNYPIYFPCKTFICNECRLKDFSENPIQDGFQEISCSSCSEVHKINIDIQEAMFQQLKD